MPASESAIGKMADALGLNDNASKPDGVISVSVRFSHHKWVHICAVYANMRK